MIATEAKAAWLHIWVFALVARSSDLYLALHWELLRCVPYMAGVFVPSLGLRLVHLDQRLQ
jgi:hypothetical protein